MNSYALLLKLAQKHHFHLGYDNIDEEFCAQIDACVNNKDQIIPVKWFIEIRKRIVDKDTRPEVLFSRPYDELEKALLWAKDINLMTGGYKVCLYACIVGEDEKEVAEIGISCDLGDYDD